ncbi:GNAT family N-acetyltransferase [Paenibacillus yanchengensis]|uniref:GNAT family N-acetyltransferase n=1 Tax=Paenibacillus yanchengensis TaxID=2035833 RepID=A0ABW4YG15_9BACL
MMIYSIKNIDITTEQVANAVLELQLTAYAVEAQLINFSALPPLQDTVPTLQRCGETFYGYEIDGVLSGVISYKKEAGVLDIHRLFVHPQQFKKGIAGRLLQFVLTHEQNFHTAIVATAAKNSPAIHFYLRHGFVETTRREVAEGLEIVQFHIQP